MKSGRSARFLKLTLDPTQSSHAAMDNPKNSQKTSSFEIAYLGSYLSVFKKFAIILEIYKILI